MSTPTGVSGHPPLKDADLKLINQALFRASQALEKIDRAKAAGIDVAGIESVREDVVAQLTALKQTYFPGAR